MKNLEGRRAIWSQQISEWQGSGMTQAEYCRKKGLSLATFGYWKRKLQLKEIFETDMVEIKMSEGLPAGPLFELRIESRKLSLNWSTRIFDIQEWF